MANALAEPTAEDMDVGNLMRALDPMENAFDDGIQYNLSMIFYE